MKKATVWLLVLVLTVSLCPVAGGVVTPDAFPIENPSPVLVAAAVENEMEALWGSSGGQQTLYFAFRPEGFVSLDEFEAQVGARYQPLLNALFAADMVGRDYITTRTSYGALRRDGEIYRYYYMVELSVHPDKALYKEIKRLAEQVEALSPLEAVQILSETLRQSIAYDAGCLKASGSYLALLEKRAVCMGYSRAFAEICRELKIPCISIVNEKHMWSAVFVEDSWQMLDVTWGIAPCERIEDAEHVFEESGFRAAQSYYYSQVLYRGKASAVYFEDLEENWYRSGVQFALGKGLFKGTEENRFSPDMPMSRGMAVTVLGRLAGAREQECSFSDVPKKAYFAGFVGWAAETGIVKGVGQGCFAPEENISREQLCTVLLRFCKHKGLVLEQAKGSLFADDGEISRWARAAVYRCNASGLVKGKGNNRFDPAAATTRAEVAVILKRLCQKFTVL